MDAVRELAVFGLWALAFLSLRSPFVLLTVPIAIFGSMALWPDYHGRAEKARKARQEAHEERVRQIREARAGQPELSWYEVTLNFPRQTDTFIVCAENDIHAIAKAEAEADHYGSARKATVEHAGSTTFYSRDRHDDTRWQPNGGLELVLGKLQGWPG